MVIDLVREAVSGNLLRWAVGKAMFCPHCQRVLDWRTSVLLKNPAVPVCAECFESITERFRDRLDADPYGYHGLSDEQRFADFEARKSDLIDIDGRALSEDLS